MTTARERYEAKTRVVTFRVHQELYDELRKVKTETGLSFADLVKLGTGIARDEIAAKITETSNLQRKLEELRAVVQAEKQLVADTAAKERQEQLGRLKHEIQVFRFFDLGWSIEEARFKLGMTQAEISQHFKVWSEMRGEREKVQVELLKKYLRRHITVLQEQILWRATGSALQESKIQLEHSRHMFNDPSRLTEEEKDFLLTEYSYIV